jgi:hypothetical protein
MSVETLGEACSQGWRVTVRCADGRTKSPRSQSSRECRYRRELDMETLVWTRGRAFALGGWRAAVRIARCPGAFRAALHGDTSWRERG